MMLLISIFLACICLKVYTFDLGSLIAPLIIDAILPSRQQLRPAVSIPAAISKLHPLPEEEILIAYSRGNSYLVSGRFEDALYEFNHALDVSGDNANVLISRGIAEEKLLQWNNAISDYRKANELIKKRPFSGDDATVFSNIGNAETGLGEWELALKDFSYAAKLNRDFLAPQIGRALVQYQLGNTEEARSFFQAITKKYPDYPDGLAAYAVMTSNYDTIVSKSSNLIVSDEVKLIWNAAITQDDRYDDVDWVTNIRRWPPKLVEFLVKFKSAL